MTELNKIIEQLSKLTLLEAAKLAKLLEEKWGCHSFHDKSTNKSEKENITSEKKKNEFTLFLKSAGDKKIAVIKAVKEILKLNLKESKNIVDSCPISIKEKLPKEDIEKYKNILTTAGATVEIK